MRMTLSAAAVVAWASLVLGGPIAGEVDKPETPPTATAASASAPAGAVIAAGETVVTLDPQTGWPTSLRVGPGREEMGRGKPAAFVEILDVRSGQTWTPLAQPPTLHDWKLETDDQGQCSAARFVHRYAGAPFQAAHTLRRTDQGLRWDVSLRLLPGQNENRSVVVAWMLPLPGGWRFWTPRDTTDVRLDTVTPARAVYGHTGFSPYGTTMPLVGVYGRRGGAAVFSPPDVQKVQITFDAFTQLIGDVPGGVSRQISDSPFLRVAHHYVGLRLGKELKLSIVVAGVRNDWRHVLGHYVRCYPELFEPRPETRKCEGMYGISGMAAINEQLVGEWAQAGVSFAEMHGSFLEYSRYVSEETLANPDLEYVCKSHPQQKTSIRNNNKWIAEMGKKGIASFMYFYNIHALPETIKQYWPDDLCLDERGNPMRRWFTEPYMHGPPDSAYGKHMIRQMEMMLQAYPDVPGFFVDNFSGEVIDFAHDDGVTMVHNRPAYDLNRNHQQMATRCFELARKAGKIIMINKIATIEACRGADMVLAEGNSLSSLRQHALACVNRPLFPLGMRVGSDGQNVERCLQQLLLVGGTPEYGFWRSDREAMKAYRPLTDAMIGKRWVLNQGDPVTLPKGLDGQIFRIDKAAPHAGDAVVVLVDLTSSWKTSGAGAGQGAGSGAVRPDLELKVRLPEAAEYKTVTLLTAESSARPPVPCQFAVSADQVTIKLPAIGAAAIVRLSR